MKKKLKSEKEVLCENSCKTVNLQDDLCTDRGQRKANEADKKFLYLDQVLTRLPDDSDAQTLTEEEISILKKMPKKFFFNTHLYAYLYMSRIPTVPEKTDAKNSNILHSGKYFWPEMVVLRFSEKLEPIVCFYSWL